MITDPRVIRLLAEGGAIEVFGRKKQDGSWRFIGRGTSVVIEEDGNDSVAVSGVPECSDLTNVVPRRWASLSPRLIHAELRSWFRDRYAESAALIHECLRGSHERFVAPKWRALFESTPPDEWSYENLWDPLVIYPYLRRDNCWVFDDSVMRIKEEAFVCGASEMISRLVSTKRIPRAEKGFTLVFSAQPFVDHDAVLSLLRPGEFGGNVYQGYVAGLGMECVLFPSLFYNCEVLPEKLYVRADPLPSGVNPIWDPPDDAEPRRFVEAPK